MRSFSIVEDQGFKILMKTGRPEYYIPSRVTVARDVKHVFQKTRKRIGKMLKVWNPYYQPIRKKKQITLTILGVQRHLKFWDRCMDITE